MADWKSSKSSSAPAELSCIVPKLSRALAAGAAAVPLLGLDKVAGSSSSKLNRSFSGAFFFGGAATTVLLSLLARLALAFIVAVVLLGPELSSSSPASYSS